MRSIRLLHLVAPLALITAGACSDSATGTNRGGLTLSISTKSAASAGLSASRLPITVVEGGNTLVITKAQVVLGKIELESGVDGCSNSGPGKACAEVQTDPILVDLPLDDVRQLDVAALVPAGTYHELEFEIDAVESNDGGGAPAFLAAHPEFRNVAVRVEGTFNGEPFVFTTSADAEFELEFEPSITIGGDTGVNLTIAIDVATWFRGTGGVLLDPRVAGNALTIVGNIQGSFSAFDDDDHDGVDDGHRR